MKKSLVLIIAIIFISVLLDACKKSSSSSSTPSYVGTWTRTYQAQLLTVVINSNGTASGTLGTLPTPSGTYTVTGNVFSFSDAVCPNFGTYNFSVNGNLLTFTLITDSCDGRYQLVPGTYNRKN